MLRRLIILILLTCYLTGVQGQWLQWHYCMGQLTSVEKAKEEEKKCPLCGAKAKKTKGCCDTETKWVKISDAHAKAVVNEPTAPSVFVTPVAIDWPQPGTDYFAASLAAKGFQANAPPLPTSVPLYLFHGVFRI